MKNYLRGFGVGVLFVTILLVVIRKPETLTDAEVQSRAARLGMLTEQEAEEKRLSAIQESELKWKDELEKQKEGYEKLLKQKDDGAPEEDGKQDEKDKPEDTTDKPENETNNKGDSDSDATGSDEQTENNPENEGDSASDGKGADDQIEDEKTPEGEQAEGGETPGLVKVEIVSGMTAEQVASMLEEAGIIESVSEFKQYLKSQNRQTLIQIGTFELRQGDDLETIINTITRR
ncbi:MAG: hypothetical protein HFI40_14965 [Lachnospiraceae bacterium]|jgi:hypothetical protein|nr:hypothetical protein [Lachnospiraceae bacterium]